MTARWGNASDPTNAQYVVQPYDRTGHLVRFTQPSSNASWHRFSWRQNQINWESHDAGNVPFASYSYGGSDIPRAGDERVHLNFWLFGGAPPANGAAAEVIVESFSFAY